MPEFCAPALGNKPNLVTIDRRSAGQRQRCALQAGIVCRWSHVLCRGRHPLLRVQPLHHPAHEDPRQGEAPGWQGDDRGRDGVRGVETCAVRSTSRSRSMASSSLKGASRQRPVALQRRCLDIGVALGSPVSLDYYDKAPFKFNGRIEQVTVKYHAVREAGGSSCAGARRDGSGSPLVVSCDDAISPSGTSARCSRDGLSRARPGGVGVRTAATSH